MKKVVQIRQYFGDWVDLIVVYEEITDFETAIDIARATKLGGIELQQESEGGTMEWDNF